jgi:hypothetical protein
MRHRLLLYILYKKLVDSQFSKSRATKISKIIIGDIRQLLRMLHMPRGINNIGSRGIRYHQSHGKVGHGYNLGK